MIYMKIRYTSSGLKGGPGRDSDSESFTFVRVFGKLFQSTKVLSRKELNFGLNNEDSHCVFFTSVQVVGLYLSEPLYLQSSSILLGELLIKFYSACLLSALLFPCFNVEFKPLIFMHYCPRGIQH